MWHCGNMGDLLTHAKLQALIHNLMQQEPSETWICRFLKNNANQITVKRACRLDPKHAQAFNKMAVVGHFKLFMSLIIDQGIPPENIYNEDEKGIQLGGGGRNNLPLQYIFSSKDCERYATWSDSLVLVTLLEAISADAAVMVCPPVLHVPPNPCFCLRQLNPFLTLSDRPPTPLGCWSASHSLSRTLVCFYYPSLLEDRKSVV